MIRVASDAFAGRNLERGEIAPGVAWARAACRRVGGSVNSGIAVDVEKTEMPL
jgi:hypothetical protein